MRKIFPVMLAAALSAFMLAGCSKPQTCTTATTAAETIAEASTAATTTAAATTAESTDAEDESTEEETDEEELDEEEIDEEDVEAEDDEEYVGPVEEPRTLAEGEAIVRVGGLKGPTTMGLVKLMDEMEQEESINMYEFTMVTAADELTALVAGGKVDIALLPANVASVLYNKTNKNIAVIDINTLGVLYLVSADTSITSMEQLKGKTIYLPGKGTTPEYALRYVLSASGLADTDVTLEFKSEASEVASILAGDPTAIGLLPQPFVTAAIAQNDKLAILMDLTEQWDEVQNEDAETASRLVTGVTIVNKTFLAEHPDQVDTFLAEHSSSTDFTYNEVDAAAELIAKAGIVAQAPLAKKALPYCNITCLIGDEMKEALSGYLNVLYTQNPESVGGTLPDDGFYYLP